MTFRLREDLDDDEKHILDNPPEAAIERKGADLSDGDTIALAVYEALEASAAYPVIDLSLFAHMASEVIRAEGFARP